MCRSASRSNAGAFGTGTTDIAAAGLPKMSRPTSTEPWMLGIAVGLSDDPGRRR